MSNYDQFIPGQWVDTIDVNDFVNLNKKPFLGEPKFLKNSTETIRSIQKFIEAVFKEENNVIDFEFSSTHYMYCDFLKENLELNLLFPENFIKKFIGISEDINQIRDFYKYDTLPKRSNNRKTSFQMFDEISTSEIKKSIKSGIFLQSPSEYTPSFIHPDVRRIALYGTKKLIKDKKNYLKTLEKHLQTSEWMQERISIHNEINALKSFDIFCSHFNVDVTIPANDSKSVINSLYLSILANFLENPSVSFSLTRVIPFLDIFLESDIENGTITEEEAQELIEMFYLRLLLLRFVYSPKLVLNYDMYPHFFGETFGGEQVTKSSYRFLSAMKRFPSFPFNIRIIWNASLPKHFHSFVQELIEHGLAVSFIEHKSLKTTEEVFVHSNGVFGVPSRDVLFDGGICDFEKVFYMSLNGGKEVSSNLNFAPITQPLKAKIIEFEDAFSRFKEYLSYVLNLYVEKMNTIMYISDNFHHHFLRSSMMDNMRFYKCQFGFQNVDKIVNYLSSIRSKNYSISMDSKGWIRNFSPNDNFIDETVFAQIVSFIEAELKKIPLYKSGTFVIEIFNENAFTISEWNGKTSFALPSEFTSSHFQTNYQFKNHMNITEIVTKTFEKDVSQIYFSPSTRFLNVSGVLFDKNQTVFFNRNN